MRFPKGSTCELFGCHQGSCRENCLDPKVATKNDALHHELAGFFEVAEFYIDEHGRLEIGHRPKAYNFPAIVERFGIKENL